MAKKKVAAKKSTSNKKPVKSAKPAKKAVKASPKKAAKKAKPAKTAKPAVKAKSKKVTKAAPKAKVSAKSKAVAKPSAKKSAKPAAKAAKSTKTAKPAKKAAAPKAAPSKSLVSAALVRPSAPKKLVDLTNFVTPLDDRLMVQLTETERKTAGGLFIPDTVADVSGNLHGTVVAVGRGHFSKKGHLQPMDVKIGDKVVFAQHSGSKIKIQNEDLIILRESDVMGVVNK